MTIEWKEFPKNSPEDNRLYLVSYIDKNGQAKVDLGEHEYNRLWYLYYLEESICDKRFSFEEVDRVQAFAKLPEPFVRKE